MDMRVSMVLDPSQITQEVTRMENAENTIASTEETGAVSMSPSTSLLDVLRQIVKIAEDTPELSLSYTDDEARASDQAVTDIRNIAIAAIEKHKTSNTGHHRHRTTPPRSHRKRHRVCPAWFGDRVHGLVMHPVN